MSYVLPSESRQVGVDGFAALPRLVVRPPGLTELPRSHPGVAAALGVLRSAPTAAATLPLREENAMKEYLLRAEARAATLAAAGGGVLTAGGAAALGSLLQDRTFVCLHYNLVKNGCERVVLLPCTEIAASDVQLGVVVRRGVALKRPQSEIKLRNQVARVMDGMLASVKAAGRSFRRPWGWYIRTRQCQGQKEKTSAGDA